MNSKNRKTLEAIFSQPTRSNIKWNDIVNLLTALGAKEIEGDGSRVQFLRGSAKLAIHRPHPGKELKQYQVELVRKFLKLLEVQLQP